MMTRLDDLDRLLAMEIYGKETPWWGEHMAQYREAFNYARGALVLDVGCGRGYGSRDLFDAGAIDVVGVDIDDRAIQIAREKNARDGVSFEVLSANDLQALTKKFDLIICFQVLERVTSPDNLMQSFTKLLNPKGVAIISTVNRARYSKLHEAPADPTHFTEFNLEELSVLLKHYFSKVEIGSLICTREDNSRLLYNSITEKIPFQLRDGVSQKILGQTYFPTEQDYVLKTPPPQASSLFYAVCRKN